MDLEDRNVTFKAEMLERFNDLFESSETWPLLKKYDKKHFDGLDHLLGRLRSTKPFDNIQMNDGRIPQFFKNCQELVKKYRVLDAAKEMSPIETIDLTYNKDFEAEEIEYCMPIKINPVEHSKKFTTRFNFELRELNMQRRRLSSQSSVGSNPSHPRIATENIRKPSHHSPNRYSHAMRPERINQQQQRQDNRTANRLDSGISSSSSTATPNPLPLNVSISSVFPPLPKFNMVEQASTSPQKLNLPPPSNQIPPPLDRNNISPKSSISTSNMSPVSSSADSSKRNQPALSYREYRQRKWEENQAKKRKSSRWDSGANQTEPMQKSLTNASNDQEKKSVDAAIQPRSVQNNSSSPSVSVLVNATKSTLNTSEQLIEKENVTSTNAPPPEQQPKEPQKLPSETTPPSLPESTKQTTQKPISENMEKQNRNEESSTQNKENSSPQSSKETNSKKELPKEQSTTEEKLDVPIKVEIKEEIDSDVETIPETFHDDKTDYSESSDDEQNEVPCEQFIPLNIKNEPIDPVPADVETAPIKSEKEPPIKSEKGDSDEEESDETMDEGETDPGSEISIESEKTDIFRNVDNVVKNEEFRAEIGRSQNKLNSGNSSGMQRVVDWLCNGRTDSPPESVGYDVPMYNDSNEGWESPPEEEEEEEENDDDDITIVRYEPDFSNKEI